MPPDWLTGIQILAIQSGDFMTQLEAYDKPHFEVDVAITTSGIKAIDWIFIFSHVVSSAAYICSLLLCIQGEVKYDIIQSLFIYKPSVQT